MCPTGYYYNGFLARHALGHMLSNVADVHHEPKCMICHIVYTCIYMHIYTKIKKLKTRCVRVNIK